jgi:hypothetical protein
VEEERRQKAIGDQVPPAEEELTEVARPEAAEPTIQYVIVAQKSGLEADDDGNAFVPVELSIHLGQAAIVFRSFRMQVWDFDIWADVHLKAVGTIPDYTVKVIVT